MNQNNFGGIDEILRYLGYDKSSRSFNFNPNNFQNNNGNDNTSSRTENQETVNQSDNRQDDNSRRGSRRRDNDRRRRNTSRNVRNNPDSASRMQWESSSDAGGNNADGEKYKVDIDPTGGAANNCCINQNLDIPCGFQDINPTVFIILGEVVGDLLSGQLPFNVANAVANWLNLIGQIVETYATQQVYSESGPGRYYSPLYKNVANPFCSCTEVSSSASGSNGNSENTSGSNNNGNSENAGSSTDSSSNGEAAGNDDNSAACSEGNNDVTEEDDDSKENLKKSIERIDSEIANMKKQFSIFNDKMEELRSNLENIK